MMNKYISYESIERNVQRIILKKHFYMQYRQLNDFEEKSLTFVQLSLRTSEAIFCTSREILKSKYGLRSTLSNDAKKLFF